jgi:hypothetical protein
MGKPEELANATAFLCSERASHITGVSLNMDGGRLKGVTPLLRRIRRGLHSIQFFAPHRGPFFYNRVQQ